MGILGMITRREYMRAARRREATSQQRWEARLHRDAEAIRRRNSGRVMSSAERARQDRIKLGQY
jgi:hypothetical protein